MNHGVGFSIRRHTHFPIKIRRPRRHFTQKSAAIWFLANQNFEVRSAIAATAIDRLVIADACWQ